MESTDLKWRTASHSSNGGGECVEVGEARRGVLVRDTKDRTGPVLRFSPAAWRRFADRLKDGRSLAGLDPSVQGQSRVLTNEGGLSRFRVAMASDDMQHDACCFLVTGAVRITQFFCTFQRPRTRQKPSVFAPSSVTR